MADGGDRSAFDVSVAQVVSRRRQRSRTISIKRLSKGELERGRLAYPPSETTDVHPRPKTRGECLAGENSQRPCAFFSCAFNLFLDVDEETGSIKINHPPADDSAEALVEVLYSMQDTCALDVADRGGVTLEECGSLRNVVRERCRQIEDKSLERLRDLEYTQTLADFLTE